MLRKLKYIIGEANQPILFSEYYMHSEFKNFNPIRAGFVLIHMEDFGKKVGRVQCTCYGESISLKLKSDPKLDAEIIKRFL